MARDTLPVIDIIALDHPSDSEKSLIRAFGGKKLNKIFDELCRKLSKKLKLSHKRIAQEIFQVNPASLRNWRGQNTKYPNGHPIPLRALSKILESLGLKNSKKHILLVSCIKKLRSGRTGSSKECKAVTRLTLDLARLCGAHAADGCLCAKHGRGVLTARWDLADQEKTNVMAVRKWIRKLFGIEVKLEKKTNGYYVKSTKQILVRYLTRIFDFPIGKKSYEVSEPKIFREGDCRILTKIPENYRKQLRLNFAKEVINFDGHSTRSGGIVSIGLGCKSKHLRRSVVEIFQLFGIKFRNYEKYNKLLTTSKKDAEKLYLLGLFRGEKRKKLKRLLEHRER